MSSLSNDDRIDEQTHGDRFRDEEIMPFLQGASSYQAIRQRDVWLRKAWGTTQAGGRRTRALPRALTCG